MNRRELMLIASAAGLALISLTLGLTLSMSATAEWKPRRPLNIIVPYNAGGGTDLYARAIAKVAESRLPVPVVIVNKPGAGGLAGALEASKARPDGNTFMLTSSGSFLLGSIFKDANVDPFDDFQTVAQVGNLKGAVAVPANSPFKTLQDLVDAAKAKPGGLRWGHNGRGGTYHVMGQTFLNNLGLKAVDVPFKGGAKSRAAILGGQVDFGVLGIQQSRGFDEKMRVLTIFAEKRDPLYPNVATAKQLGFNVPIISSPIILFAPNGVGAEIMSGMEAVMADIAASPEFAEIIKAKGTSPDYKTGAKAEADLKALGRASMPVLDALKR